jgi:hypothetical protein
VISRPGSAPTGHRVFLVHGHDQAVLQEVARFLERLDQDVIILREQPNRGRTIIEKFEDYGDVGFAVILLTPDYRGGPASDPATACQPVDPNNPPKPTPAAPTGLVWNPTATFLVPKTTLPATFIWDTEDGTISAWTGGLTPNDQAVLAKPGLTVAETAKKAEMSLRATRTALERASRTVVFSQRSRLCVEQGFLNARSEHGRNRRVALSR